MGELELIKCFNVHCDDHDAEADNGCYYSDFPDKCIGFVSKERWKTKMEELGLGKLSDPEYGCRPERNRVNMEDNKKQAGGTPPNAGSRLNTRGVLQNQIKTKRKELEALITLDESIKWDLLNPQQEKMLWHYFSSYR